MPKRVRRDVVRLSQEGRRLLRDLTSGETPDVRAPALTAWLSHVELFEQDAAATQAREALRSGLRMTREGAAGAGPSVLEAVQGVTEVVGALSFILAQDTFARAPVEGRALRRFLEWALRAGRPKGDDVEVHVADIASGAQLDAAAVGRCIHRVLDDDLAYQAADQPDRLTIRSADARLLLDQGELDRASIGPGDGVARALPDTYQHLASAVATFHADAPFEKSVFVMMKFPERNMATWQRACLEEIYRTIGGELARHGLTARRADQKTYATSRLLWDNLCVYMLGCKLGIAVLEDRTGKELNPNVTLEYGFMTALGREVILLQERKFQHLRADLIGKIPQQFAVRGRTVDRQSVQEAIAAWLTDVGIAPLRSR